MAKKACGVIGYRPMQACKRKTFMNVITDDGVVMKPTAFPHNGLRVSSHTIASDSVRIKGFGLKCRMHSVKLVRLRY